MEPKEYLSRNQIFEHKRALDRIFDKGIIYQGTPAWIIEFYTKADCVRTLAAAIQIAINEA